MRGLNDQHRVDSPFSIPRDDDGPATRRARAMEDIDRQRTLEYFERLGKERVRLYAAIDCERFLGGWQVRELADQWLAGQDGDNRARPLWRRLLRRQRQS